MCLVCHLILTIHGVALIKHTTSSLRYLHVLYKWHKFLHGAFDFRYCFHPVHDVPVIGEISTQLIVHLLECV